jgi:hypothetical protein
MIYTMKETYKVIVLILIFLLIGSPITLIAQSKKNQDKKAILKMCGCFEINFKFIETFNYSEYDDYRGSDEYESYALELALPIVNEKNKISIQHLLIVGSVDEKYVIKHWRQDWLYQNYHLFKYEGERLWKSKKIDRKSVRGQWTQKVYQVDDSPRYEGTSSWVHVDGKSFWENETMAPLPRREYTKRDDYNIMRRGNRHEITDNGWVHKQNNSKIIKTDYESIILADEIGYSPYTRVNYDRCKLALDWWNSKKLKWNSIRNEWDKIYSSEKNISLKKKVDGMFLYEHLMFTDNYDKKETHGPLIKSFLNN